MNINHKVFIKHFGDLPHTILLNEPKLRRYKYTLTNIQTLETTIVLAVVAMTAIHCKLLQHRFNSLNKQETVNGKI